MTSICASLFLQPELSVRKYSFFGARAHHYRVSSSQLDASGFGGDLDPLVAQRKALFEFVERMVFRQFREADDHSSSGWAAHESLDLAKRASRFELLERDALLVSWLSRTSPRYLGLTQPDSGGSQMHLLEFGRGSDFVVLGMLLESDNHRSRMLISTCSSSVTDGIEKLRVDSERALILMRNQGNNLPEQMRLHQFEFCEALALDIDWLFKNGAGLIYPDIEFEYRSFEVPIWNGKIAYVCRAHSHYLQELFYGSAKIGNINRRRLRPLLSRPYRLNRMVHPIL